MTKIKNILSAYARWQLNHVQYIEKTLLKTSGLFWRAENILKLALYKFIIFLILIL